MVEKARSKPLTAEDVKKQLVKLGDTFFSAGDIRVETDEDAAAFVPVGIVNDIRRKALSALEERLVHGPV